MVYNGGTLAQPHNKTDPDHFNPVLVQNYPEEGEFVFYMSPKENAVEVHASFTNLFLRKALREVLGVIHQIQET